MGGAKRIFATVPRHHSIHSFPMALRIRRVSQVAAGKHRIRGDINTLIVGDPGLAKSQFLKRGPEAVSMEPFDRGSRGQDRVPLKGTGPRTQVPCEKGGRAPSLFAVPLVLVLFHLSSPRFNPFQPARVHFLLGQVLAILNL